MSLWYCRGCTAAYAPGLARCPQCGANDPARQPPAPASSASAAGATPLRPATRRRKVTDSGSEPGEAGQVATAGETPGSADG